MSFSRGDRARRRRERRAGAAPQPRRPGDRRQRRVPRLRRQRGQQPGARRRRLAARATAAPSTSSSAASASGTRWTRPWPASASPPSPWPSSSRSSCAGSASTGERRRGARAAAERAGRARIVVADVADLLAAGGPVWDVVALDTDNGPEWLVRGENARLYASSGLCRVARARCGPAASPSSGRPSATPPSRATSGTCSTSVVTVAAVDVIDGRPLEYTMYVARRATATERSPGVD